MGDKWVLTLSGNQIDLKELAKSCTRPEISVIERSAEFFLESSDFTETDTSDSIWEKAAKIIPQLNGACRLALSSLTPLQYTVQRLREDGTRVLFPRETFHARETRLTPSVQVIRADGTVEEINQADSIPLWLSLARPDPKVASVLELLSEHDWASWVNLYRIFEVVESDLGSGAAGRKAMVSQGWVTSDDIVRFRYTANSVKELGKEARHGDEAEASSESSSHTDVEIGGAGAC